jgi:uncharacterized protein (DUF1778 family)
MTVRKTDRRPTLTLKGDEFGPEFRALLNKAAKKAGKTQAAFAAEVLDREARRVLRGDPLDTPDSTPAPSPAIIERVDATDKRLDELTAQLQRLTELQQRSLWQRLRGALGGGSGSGG